jgi:hypothetical protein
MFRLRYECTFSVITLANSVSLKQYCGALTTLHRTVMLFQLIRLNMETPWLYLMTTVLLHFMIRRPWLSLMVSTMQTLLLAWLKQGFITRWSLQVCFADRSKVSRHVDRFSIGLQISFSPGACIAVGLDSDGQTHLKIMEHSYGAEGGHYDESTYAISDR